ncbi:2-hydroxyglutaryl-CoA dehydratase, D-component [archaeon BMS3Abin16]|nr:2-hydroxyglutaryl-CoA dehydratase, D-component [archaeon BMS3Abin16]
MAIVGITALVPPEIVYASGNIPVDINNFVPRSGVVPRDKLCAWTALWRDLTLMGRIKLDKLVVVAGGDCNNALVDGEKIELSGVDTHYFTYPFDGSAKIMRHEIDKLVEFLGGELDESVFNRVTELKSAATAVDSERVSMHINSQDAFEIMVSGSDLAGSLEDYRKMIDSVVKKRVDCDFRLALLGTPPIYDGFHEFLDSLGLHIVYDEMPYEFLRLRGDTVKSISESYADYSFARNITHRIKLLKSELKQRGVEGIIHFHQFACHHKLEDPILREALCAEGYPFITIEADLPSKTPQQTRLRIEAFKERLGDL